MMRLKRWQKLLNEARDRGFPVDSEKYFGKVPEDCISAYITELQKDPRGKGYGAPRRDSFEKCVEKAGFKLHQNFGNLIRISLNNRGGAKNGMSAFDTVSYAIDELRAHLESQFGDKMNWDNYGSYWHVDHIMPRAHFEFESVKDEGFQRCWALENLQPLEAKANLRKGDRILINE